MNIKKIITGLTLLMLLSSCGATTGFNKGFQAFEAGDFKTTLAEWNPLAEKGNVEAQYSLGVMYATGEGVPKNDKTAVKWFTKAAEQGEASAQINLGVMYSNGEGVPENDKTAVKWYTLAAGQGNANAQSNLGFMYEYGEGVVTDTKRAYMWYNLGSYNGNKIAGENKDEIAKRMTPADISKAQDMSSACLASNYTDC